MSFNIGRALKGAGEGAQAYGSMYQKSMELKKDRDFKNQQGELANERAIAMEKRRAKNEMARQKVSDKAGMARINQQGALQKQGREQQAQIDQDVKDTNYKFFQTDVLPKLTDIGLDEGSLAVLGYTAKEGKDIAPLYKSIISASSSGASSADIAKAFKDGTSNWTDLDEKLKQDWVIKAKEAGRSEGDAPLMYLEDYVRRTTKSSAADLEEQKKLHDPKDPQAVADKLLKDPTKRDEVLSQIVPEKRKVVEELFIEGIKAKEKGVKEAPVVAALRGTDSPELTNFLEEYASGLGMTVQELSPQMRERLKLSWAEKEVSRKEVEANKERWTK